MEMGTFSQVAVILAIATAIGFLGRALRQPLIISFLFAGIVVGPSVLGLVDRGHEIELLASFGIALLLFVVGLKLDVTMIRTIGPVALATGLGQVVFTALVGFLIAIAFGMGAVGALYVAVALTFSSTIIIVKLLSDKKEIDSLHGRIAVGFLIVQDIVVVLALMLLTAIGGADIGDGAGVGSVLPEVLRVLGAGLGMLVVVVLLARFVLPRLLRELSGSPEMLLLFAIAWAIVLAAAGDMLGFSKEVGAFLAGVALASTEQREIIGSRLTVLRDFLLLFFFIVLGASLDIGSLGDDLLRATVFSLFVLVGNPLIVMVIMGIMGYRARTGFKAGLAVAQISEFSLLLATLGVEVGHIGAAELNLVTVVGLITISASTYMILYSDPLYDRLHPVLRFFERENPAREPQAELAPVGADERLVILIGLGGYGSAIAHQLRERGWSILAVDFDPDVRDRAEAMGLRFTSGDLTDPDLLANLPTDSAEWVLSTVRNRAHNESLMRHLRDTAYAGRLAIAASNAAEAMEYRGEGVDVVLEPFSDAADRAAEQMTETIQALPALRHWPARLEEVLLRPGSPYAGKPIGSLDLRKRFRATILAIHRAGAVIFHPGPDERLTPGDRLVLLSPTEHAHDVVEQLRQRTPNAPVESMSAFSVIELEAGDLPGWRGRTLAEIDVRRVYGVTVVGIERGGRRSVSPPPTERLDEGDRLVLLGTPERIAALHAGLVSD
ncbi:MAG: cation:proton antiporter [Phycisphaerales bacterium]